MHLRYSIALGAALGAAVPAAGAAGLTVGVEVPRLDVAEYHRPYVAVWLEGADPKAATNLAVWYQLDKRGSDEGTKWLKDMRQWWRRTGRELSMPVDGVSSATRPAGRHKLSFREGAAPLGSLPAGDYKLLVEAAREVGGRELLSIPFRWPPAAPQQLQARGATELGEVTLDLAP